ncbi:alternative oxidase [Candidatus Gracilibacteria bacterium]|nr:alternative oxidase [Candidatus Gracilibacteria bacterium]MCF7898939.1 alternative oxidase [Candidatus Paceibacterota bacterium]
MFEDLKNVSPHITAHSEHYSFKPKDFRSKIAKIIVHISAQSADFVFKERYGHRAIVLETIAAIPGVVGALFQHLKSLRLIKDDRGWIQTLLDEAENERMHLLVYSTLAQPTKMERFLIIFVQFFFFIFYFFLYLFSPRTAHRVVGYFEEEAVNSYEHFLRLVEDGTHENVEAPEIAMSYWNLKEGARLTDVIKATIRDEMIHRDVNHKFADDGIGVSAWK